MDKPAVAGIEVSAEVLPLAFDKGNCDPRSFPTPPRGTSRCCVFCARTPRRFASAWNRQGSMVWMPPSLCTALQQGRDPRRARVFARCGEAKQGVRVQCCGLWARVSVPANCRFSSSPASPPWSNWNAKVILTRMLRCSQWQKLLILILVKSYGAIFAK